MQNRQWPVILNMTNQLHMYFYRETYKVKSVVNHLVVISQVFEGVQRLTFNPCCVVIPRALSTPTYFASKVGFIPFVCKSTRRPELNYNAKRYRHPFSFRVSLCHHDSRQPLRFSWTTTWLQGERSPAP